MERNKRNRKTGNQAFLGLKPVAPPTTQSKTVYELRGEPGLFPGRFPSSGAGRPLEELEHRPAEAQGGKDPGVPECSLGGKCGHASVDASSGRRRFDI